ncbi:colanic acid biosynthesis glycosyltransferase WcaL [Pontibacter saemangeumensis]|uniref:Colanic acid biosynthesis glycosyltransferase WcaL n=1 Tax=Pontibacter saemangeumensis TaxID=1084525 RepID=A0ABP8LCU3_9BACT
MIDAGVEVQIFSYYRPDPSQKLQPQFKAYNLQERVRYGVPLPVNRVKKYTNFVRHINHKRLSFFNSLNFFKFGKEVLNLRYFYRALLFADYNEFDIIHCHFGPIGHDIVQLRSMGLLKGKVVTSFHGYDFQNRDILDEFRQYKQLFKNGDGFIANSNFTYKSLVALGCSPIKLIVIPVSSSSKVFDFQASNVRESAKVFKILTIARLEEVKGIEYAIGGMHLLQQKFNFGNFTYNIIGSGSLENKLKELVDKLELSNKIHFLGSKTQDEVFKFLLDTNVFLLTSVTTNAGAAEAQGLALLEAQAAGVPVVASRTGGVPDSLIDGETGILVPEKDVDAIASAIIKLYNDPTTSGEMGARGRTFVKENFDQEALCTKMISFYNKLLKANSARS